MQNYTNGTIVDMNDEYNRNVDIIALIIIWSLENDKINI